MSQKRAKQGRREALATPRAKVAVSRPSSPGEIEERAQAAQHECGHAAVRWALSSPFLRVTMMSPMTGGLPAVEPLPGAKILSGPSMLIGMAGFVADYQRRNLRMRDSQIVKAVLGGGSDDRFEVDNAAGQVAVRPTRGVQRGHDLYDMASRAVRDRWAPQVVVGMWRDAERFTAALRPAIDATAPVLAEQGEISYDGFAGLAAAAMAGQPAPMIPQWVAAQ